MRGVGASIRRAEREAIAAQRRHQRNIAAQHRQQRQAVLAEQREEREALRQRKHLLAQMREMEKLDALARAANDVALYENYLSTLVSIHKECWLPWSWDAVAQSGPPEAPVYIPAAESQAQAALAAYVPSLSERMLGNEPLRRAELMGAVEAARRHDHSVYNQALEYHRYELGRWEWLRKVSVGVLAGDPHAYAAVIEHLSPFDELSDLGSDVKVNVREPWYLEAKLSVREADVVPNEIYSLQASGKLATKKMPKARYWEIYQDHVCSCALRVARELFALLPIDIALVQVHGLVMNKATGHEELQPLLSVGFSRATVDRLNLDAIDPSDSMSNFIHRMSFTKSAGFKPIEPLTPADFAPASGRAPVMTNPFGMAMVPERR